MKFIHSSSNALKKRFFNMQRNTMTANDCVKSRARTFIADCFGKLHAKHFGALLCTGHMTYLTSSLNNFINPESFKRVNTTIAA